MFQTSHGTPSEYDATKRKTSAYLGRRPSRPSGKRCCPRKSRRRQPRPTGGIHTRRSSICLGRGQGYLPRDLKDASSFNYLLPQSSRVHSRLLATHSTSSSTRNLTSFQKAHLMASSTHPGSLSQCLLSQVLSARQDKIFNDSKVRVIEATILHLATPKLCATTTKLRQ